MKFTMPKSVTILGVKYKIVVTNVSEDPRLTSGANAYVDHFGKKIVIGNLSDDKTYPYAAQYPDHAICRYKHELKHEITHAFFYESGLGPLAKTEDSTWFKNESLVDWIAIQGDKLYKIWDRLGLND